MSHMHTHGGHAAAARRRGEQWLGCTRCGIRHEHIRYQAARPPSRLSILIGLVAQVAAAGIVAVVAFAWMVGLLIGVTA